MTRMSIKGSLSDALHILLSITKRKKYIVFHVYLMRDDKCLVEYLKAT